MSPVVPILFGAGLALLVLGAEALVRGASRLAVTLGISPLVVGLTVVAFGTSSPELAVSVRAALSGQAGADLAIGNVVGSNIFNVLFILGISATIAPLIVSQQLVRRDVPIMVGCSLLLFWLARDGNVSGWDGLLLSVLILGYTAFAIVQGREEAKSNPAVRDEYGVVFGARVGGARAIALNAALVGVGLAMLVLGAQWLVASSISFARALGVSELVIALTIVAAGTSLPEVATSVMASIRGERDIAVGNVVGSNIFNVLAVLGLSAMVAPAGINVPDVARNFDLPVMTAVAVACLPIFFTGHLIARWEGFLFLGYYAAYVVMLTLSARGSASFEPLGSFMLFFVVPLTFLTLTIGVWRQLRRKAV